MPNLPSEIGHIEAAEVARLVATSVQLINDLQDKSGAYPASPTFSAYRGYCWFRDGAFIADGMSSAGEVESANRFFDWCSRVLESRAEDVRRIVAAAADGDPVPDRDMLPTRFTFAGGDGEDDWWDFQLDGYGTWLWAVCEHALRHGISLERWRPAIELTVDYLASSWQRPCFDWWEENPGEVHVSTLGCIAAGLTAVSRSGILGERRTELASATALAATQHILDRGLTNEHLAKWVGSEAVDASLLAVVFPLRVVEPKGALGLATTAAIDEQLNVGGGVHRYLADTFFGGGQWPLLSCLLGLGFEAAGLHERALDQLRWAGATVSEEGWMPEQVDDHLLDSTRYQEWVDRWGPVAQPLLWTHAMYIRLAVEVGLAGEEAN